MGMQRKAIGGHNFMPMEGATLQAYILLSGLPTMQVNNQEDPNPGSSAGLGNKTGLGLGYGPDNSLGAEPPVLHQERE